MRFKLRYLLPLVLLATSSYGADFETLAGSSMPSIRSRELRSYFADTVIPARVAECEAATYSKTFYVDYTSGSDSNNGTADTTPLKTIDLSGGLNDKLASETGNYRILFKRDQRHPTSEGVGAGGVLDDDDVLIGAYGTGAKPVIHLFRNSVSSGGSWTQDGDAWYTSCSTAVGWVRVGTNFETRMDPLTYRSSLANVQNDADNRGWWWDDPNDRLYVNLNDATPGATVVEWSNLSEIAQQGINIQSGADRVIVENLVIEGFGAGPGGTGNACYGIKSASSDRLLVRDCEAYYNGSHAMGANGGGIQTWIRCKGGLCFKSDHNTSTFVFYKSAFDSTNDECIFQECECVAGFLPDATNEPRTFSSLHEGWYAHNASGVTTYDLILLLDCRDTAPTWRTNWTANYGGVWFSNSPGSDSVESTYRTLVIGHKVVREVEGHWACAPRTAYITCLYDLILPSTTTATQMYDSSSTNFGGRQFRNIFRINDLRSTATTRFLCPNGAVVFDGCTFDMNGIDATNSFIFNAGETSNGTSVASNCLLIRAGAKGFANGAGNNTSRWPNLAMWRPRTGSNATYDWSTTDLLLTSLDTQLGAFTSPKDTQAETGAFTSGPDYDYYWRTCPSDARSFGAIEANTGTPNTLDTLVDRLGPFTGDTANNSVYGALRAMANSVPGFDSPDLVQDDGDGAGDFNQETGALQGIRDITANGLFQAEATAATDGSTTTVVASTLSATNDKYNDGLIVMLSGNAAGETRRITDYDGGTKTLTVSPAFAGGAAANGDTFFIIRDAPATLTASSAVGSVTGNVGGNVTGSVGSVTSGVTLSNDAVTAASIATDAGQELADALLDRSNGVETGWTLRQALKVMTSVMWGKSSGSPGSTSFRDINDTKARITSTISNGNRTAVTVDKD